MYNKDFNNLKSSPSNLLVYKIDNIEVSDKDDKMKGHVVYG
jgi:hypothetical protein